MYSCELCNYNTQHSGNYNKHCNTTGHIQNEKLNNYCSICKKKYSSSESYRKHKYNTHTKIKNVSTKTKSIMKKTNINSTENNIIKHVTEEMKDVKEEINKSKKEVVIVVNKAITKASSLIKYLMENHASTPPLKKITNKQCIKLLRIDYNCPERDNDYTLQQTFIAEHSKGTFISNIAKSILKIVHYKNPDKQPIWNTDCSRLHYVVKTSDNWDEDKAGIKFTDYIIRPLLCYIRELIKDYRENHLENINMYKNNFAENTEYINKLHATFNLEGDLMSETLIKPILKELSPYLRYLHHELEEMEKMEELEQIQEELKEIIKNNDNDKENNNDNYNDNDNTDTDSFSIDRDELNDTYNNVDNYISDDDFIEIKKYNKRMI